MLDLIFLVGIIQGSILVLAYSFKFLGKKKKNPFFLLLIGAITLALVSKYMFSIEKYYSNPWIWYYADIIAYLVGPLWFFTISKSIVASVNITWKDVALLSPMLFHIGFIIHIHTLDSTTLIASSDELWFEVSFVLFCITVFFVNSLFIYRSHQIINNFNDSRFPDFIIKGQYGFIAILMIWILAFTGTLFLEISIIDSEQLYTLAFASLSFVVLVVALLSIVRPELFNFLTQTYDSDEKIILREIAVRIKDYLENEKPYLDKAFSLKALSIAIESNSVLTSRAINQILESNFNELINSHRIQHFTRIAKADKQRNYTLWAIAQESGFGNKATFYSAFKKIMGSTPKEYLTSISREV